jgi:hypothetical protein
MELHTRGEKQSLETLVLPLQIPLQSIALENKRV